MQHLPGKRVLALVFGLAAATVGSVYAQDTTETGRAAIDTTAPAGGAIDTGAIDTGAVDTSAVRDTTDTSGVENPPGYRGMERDTTIFPPDSGNAPTDAGAVEDQSSGTYDDSAAQDSARAARDAAEASGVYAPTETAGATDTSTGPVRQNPEGVDSAAQGADGTQ